MKLQGDTLSRQYLLAEIDDLADEFSELDENGLHNERWCGISDSKRVIMNAPTIEPKHGKWIWVEQILGLVCSECKELGVERSNFCPNCGADMRERTNVTIW